jgi:phasin family protein
MAKSTKKPAKKSNVSWAKPATPKAKAQSSAAPNAWAAPGVWPASGLGNLTSATTPKNMESWMNKSQSQFDNFSKDQSAVLQETMQAYMKSGKIAAERMQEMMTTWTQMAQEMSERQAAAMQTMMACKTLPEVTEAQGQLAQKSFDDFMQTFTKMTEMTVKMATETMEPINDQMGKAIKKATDQMAA